MTLRRVWAKETAHGRKINAYIPAAKAEAQRRIEQLDTTENLCFVWKKGKDGKPFKFYLFTLFFHREMNRLTIAAGLRR